MDDYIDEILEESHELSFKQAPWATGSYLREWQMDAPESHELRARLFRRSDTHLSGHKEHLDGWSTEWSFSG